MDNHIFVFASILLLKIWENEKEQFKMVDTKHPLFEIIMEHAYGEKPVECPSQVPRWLVFQASPVPFHRRVGPSLS